MILTLLIIKAIRIRIRIRIRMEMFNVHSKIDRKSV